MDIQLIIVGVIILGAVLFVGKQIFHKAKSIVGKSSCGSDCGCDSKITRKIPVQIKRNY